MAKKIILLLFCVFLCLSVLDAYSAAGENPFVSKKQEKNKEITLDYPVFVQKFILKIGSVQRDLNRKMTELGRQIKTGSNLKAFFTLILIAFFYGVIHSLGPGHGKTIAVSYFLTEHQAIWKGIILGVVIAFTQVISALAVVVSLYFIVRIAFLSSFESFLRVVKLVSSVIIVGLGLMLILRAILNKGKTRSGDEEIDASRHLLAVALSIGIIPCPGAALFLMFIINMEILTIGIPLVFIMAAGMAVTISSVGSITIAAKDSVLRCVAARTRVGLNSFFHSGLKILGALFIVIIGSLLLLGNL